MAKRLILTDLKWHSLLVSTRWLEPLTGKEGRTPQRPENSLRLPSVLHRLLVSAKETQIKGTDSSGNKGNFESGQNKCEVCLLLYSNIENATPCSLPWTHIANFFSETDNIL